MRSLAGMGLALAAASAWAQSNYEKARCGAAVAQIQEARIDQTEKARLDLMNMIVDDLGLLRKVAEEKKMTPAMQAKWKKCFEQKQEAYRIHDEALTNGAKTLHPYFMISGKYSFAMGDYGDAHNRFKAAADTRITDFEALARTFEAWRLWKKKELASTELTLIEIEAYKRDSQAMLKKLITHPNATTPAKVNAHFGLYQDMLRLGQEAAAMEELRSVLVIDPNNAEALDILSSFEIRRGRPRVAREYLEQLKKNRPLTREYSAKLIEIQLIQDSFTEALLTSQEALKKFPGDFEISALKASALAMNGRLNEAKALNQKLIKIDPKNQRLRDSLSRVLEKEGDISRGQDLPGKALAEYKTGLDYSPERIALRVKMASLIYDFRRERNFEPEDVTVTDMNEVVRLLTPALDTDPPREDVLLLYLGSAKRSQLHGQATKVCEDLERSQSKYPTANAVLDCAEILAKNQKAATARRILEQALFMSKFSTAKDRLRSAYEALKKP